MRSSALLELVRIRLLPTAWTDIAAGVFLATGSPEPTTFAAAVLLSSSLYLFGMTSNAVFDLNEDRKRFPDRPLPSGRMRLREAKLLALALIVFAGLMLLLLPLAGAATALVLFALIVLYNTRGKRIPVAGPLLMGGCRSLNLLLGAVSAAPAAATVQKAAVPALILGAYVGLVTFLNTQEGKSQAHARVPAAGCLLLLIPAVLFFQAGGVSLLHAAALALLILLSIPWKENTLTEAPVHKLLAGIFLVDGFFLAESGRLLPATACFALALVYAAPLFLEKQDR